MIYRAETFDLLRIGRSAVDRYALQSILDYRLSDPFENRISWAQTAAQNINTVRAAGNDGAPPVTMGTLYALTLLSEAYLRVISAVSGEKPDLIDNAVPAIQDQMGENACHRVFISFLDEFPVRSNYRHYEDPSDYLRGSTHGQDNRNLTLLMMCLTWLHSSNPSIKGYADLFDTVRVAERSDWNDFLRQLTSIWDAGQGYGPDNDSLTALLKRPMEMEPHSLEAQLRYIATHWQSLLGDFAAVLLRGADVIREETKPPFTGDPGPARVPDYGIFDSEVEAFSSDHDWMPSVVLLAKNSYVWLEQLSREYGMPINRLDQIPEDALFQIARRGFNALWLIGLWSRSPASQTIKQMCGNPEAAASAYSLHDYRIADDLGGEEAFTALKSKAWRHGIRLAGDMVPNHMGIDSRWVCDHPEWFISSEHAPFAHYTFNGVNLSPDPNCSIHLEDHYYSRSDAAVVFKHTDNRSGQTRYIYHGNDGTGLPWNDTAQLDFLKDAVREQVINTIIDVARKFPIIRFDAAMTLTKKHFHRLWYPEPGQGGDIASRSWFGLSRQQFDERMPNEFWRDVVEQVAARAPDTLLLAEAFWLMEGYFVRTLGMHRVYNSAFMNMLSREDNQKYREVIKNTLEFDPGILKRYVNFMNNPDEEPAVIQFGKGEKYFGVCAMMSTLPGLPMFGHGQFEGFTEKYGMEYRRSYWSEEKDAGLIAYHERIITPLLKNRALFAGSEHFRLFDFYVSENTVNENVFAYSNQRDSERTLFIFNNSNGSTQGWIHATAAWRQKIDDTSSELRRESLGTAWGLSGRDDSFVLLYDVVKRHWLIRRSSLICGSGMMFILGSYECHVFTRIQELRDTPEKKYAQLEQFLEGKGCSDIEETWLDLPLQSFHHILRNLSDSSVLAHFDRMTRPYEPDQDDSDPIDFDELKKSMMHRFEKSVEGIPNLPEVSSDRFIEVILDTIEEHLLKIIDFRSVHPGRDRLMMIWYGCLQKALCSISQTKCDTDFRIWRLLEAVLVEEGLDNDTALSAARVTNDIVSNSFSKDSFQIHTLLHAGHGRNWNRVNQYMGVAFFNKEACDELLDLCMLWGVLNRNQVDSLSSEARHHGYRYKEFLDALISNK